MTQVTPFLMFDDQLEAALGLYARVFPDFRLERVARSGSDGPVASAAFSIGAQRFEAFNGGPHFRFSEGVSLLVSCEDQAEVDRVWAAFVEAGGNEVQCGWLRDPFGLSWQVVPRRFFELVGDPDPARVQAVMGAMLQMVKLDVAALERAYEDA